MLVFLVRKMWELLATSHAPNTANDNLANKPYFCLGLLDNLIDLLITLDNRLIILGGCIPFLPD